MQYKKQCSKEDNVINVAVVIFTRFHKHHEGGSTFILLCCVEPEHNS